MARRTAPTTPRPIPAEELQRLAEDHVSYELQQMALGVFRRPPDEQYLANVIQEAFLVHIRVLDDFLGKGTPWGEDVLAIDYCSTWVPEYALSDDDRDDVDRRVAHLTLRRSERFQWGARHRLARDVIRVFNAFAKQLEADEPTRAPWIVPHLHEARRLISATSPGWPTEKEVSRRPSSAVSANARPVRCRTRAGSIRHTPLRRSVRA